MKTDMTNIQVLTAPAGFGMLNTSKVQWGRPAPRNQGEKGVISFKGVSAPEMCLPARAAAVHWTVDSLRRFFASEIQNPVRCFMAQINDLTDRLNVCKSKVSFLTDVFSQDHATDFRFSEDGLSGLYFILRDIEGEIEFIVNELSAKEV
jgi:hypothetical protein